MRKAEKVCQRFWDCTGCNCGNCFDCMICKCLTDSFLRISKISHIWLFFLWMSILRFPYLTVALNFHFKRPLSNCFLLNFHVQSPTLNCFPQSFHVKTPIFDSFSSEFTYLKSNLWLSLLIFILNVPYLTVSLSLHVKISYIWLFLRISISQLKFLTVSQNFLPGRHGGFSQ